MFEYLASLNLQIYFLMSKSIVIFNKIIANKNTSIKLNSQNKNL